MHGQESNEQKKQYLMSYKWACFREKQILDDIQELRNSKMHPSVVNDGMPKGNEQRDLSDYAAKLDHLIQLLENERIGKIQLLIDIEKKINAVENAEEQEVLRLRYIKGLKWEAVAVKMNIGYRHVLRIHGKALKNFKMS